jgi:hypothetical protein
MALPRMTELMEKWDREILSGLDSPDEATRLAASSAAVSFAVLRELKKIRLILERATDIEIDDEANEDEENQV